MIPLRSIDIELERFLKSQFVDLNLQSFRQLCRFPLFLIPGRYLPLAFVLAWCWSHQIILSRGEKVGYGGRKVSWKKEKKTCGTNDRIHQKMQVAHRTFFRQILQIELCVCIRSLRRNNPFVLSIDLFRRGYDGLVLCFHLRRSLVSFLRNLYGFSALRAPGFLPRRSFSEFSITLCHPACCPGDSCSSSCRSFL